MRSGAADLVELAADRASARQPGEAFEICLSRTSTAEVCIENGRISFARCWDEDEGGVKAIRDGVVGFAYATGITPESLQQLKERAAEMAHWVGRGNHPGFPQPVPEEDVPAPSPPMDSMADLSAAATQVLRLLAPYRSEFQLEFLKLTSSREETAVANSSGLHVGESLTRLLVDALGVAHRGSDVSSLQVLFDGGYRLEDVDLEQRVRALAKQAKACLGAGPAPNWRGVPVVLAPLAVQQLLLETVLQATDGYRVLAGQSQWNRSLGTAVASPLISLVDDNSLPGFLGTCRYDRDGQPMASVQLLEQGRLVDLLLDRVTAYRLGLPCTCRAGGGPESTGMVAPTNLVMEAGDSSLAELVASIDQGIYVERLALNKHSANGAFFGSIKGGRLIQGGYLTRPVTGSILSGNSFVLLRGVSGVTRERVKLGNCLLPYVLTGPGDLSSA